MSWFDEYYGVEGAVDLQLEFMSPFNAYELVREPTMENLVKTAYMPSMAYLGYTGASWMVGQSGPGFWVRQAIRYENIRTTVRAGSRLLRPVILGLGRLTPHALFYGALYGTGQYLQSVYHDLSGMYIGDMRFSRY